MWEESRVQALLIAEENRLVSPPTAYTCEAWVSKPSAHICAKPVLKAVIGAKQHYCEDHRRMCRRMFLRYELSRQEAEFAIRKGQVQEDLLSGLGVSSVRPFEGSTKEALEDALLAMTAVMDYRVCFLSMCSCESDMSQTILTYRPHQVALQEALAHASLVHTVAELKEVKSRDPDAFVIVPNERSLESWSTSIYTAS